MSPYQRTLHQTRSFQNRTNARTKHKRDQTKTIKIPVPNTNIKGNSQQIHIAAPTIEETLQTVDVTNS